MSTFSRQQFARALRSASEHFNGRRWPEAEAQARTALNFSPDDPAALNLCAGAAMEGGRHEDAIPLFKRASKLEPKSPFIQFNLGEAYRRTGAYAQALPCFHRAAALKPDFAEAIALAGESLYRIGRNNEAERHLRKALGLAPSLPSALHGLGLLLLDKDEPASAADCLSHGLNATSPDHSLRPSLLANLGRARLQLGDGQRGLEALSEAIQARPSDAELWRLLATSLRDTRTAPEGEEFRNILLQLFDRSDVNPRDLASAALGVLQQNNDMAAFLREVEARPCDVESIVAEHEVTAARLAQDPLLHCLLVSAPVSSPAIELFVTQLRSELLSLLDDSPESRAGELELAVALARQSYLNEYVQFISDDDEMRVHRLVESLDREDLGHRAGDALRVAIVASYRPLSQTVMAARCTRQSLPELSDIIREQLEEPQQEKGIRARLRVLKPAQDPTSLAVQQQYEESPYPRWTRCNAAEPIPFKAALKTALPHLPAIDIPEIVTPRILIAGCGTGLETMRVLHSYRNASVLAVDLSAASLAYSVRKTREYGYPHVEHLQADILDLAELSEKFDLIESFGVLHHMADPNAGLVVVAGLLRPKGLISVGLYSEIGRRAVVEARDHIARQRYATNLDGIRRLRRELITKKRPELEAVVSPASDFWTTSDCRDLLFHVNEHRFTLLEIGDMLKGAGLEFLGLEFSHGADRLKFLAEQPQTGAIQDTETLHRYECDHPELFADTYRIWARLSRRYNRKAR